MYVCVYVFLSLSMNFIKFKFTEKCLLNKLNYICFNTSNRSKENSNIKWNSARIRWKNEEKVSSTKFMCVICLRVFHVSPREFFCFRNIHSHIHASRIYLYKMFLYPSCKAVKIKGGKKSVILIWETLKLLTKEKETLNQK